MTKSLTERAEKRELDGYYYADVHQYEGECEEDRFVDIVHCDQYGVSYGCHYDGWDSIIEEVPSYDEAQRLKWIEKDYNKLEQRLYNKDQGIFPVLNIVLRNIEREQCRRKLTDLELSIKSQVKGVLAFNGLVSNSDESVTKCHQLEKRLEIATKALKETKDRLLKIELSNLNYEERHKLYDIMFADGVIDRALLEIEGVK